jgi:hypothetical protein
MPLAAAAHNHRAERRIARVPVAGGDHDAQPHHRFVVHVWRRVRGRSRNRVVDRLARSDLRGLLCCQMGSQGPGKVVAVHDRLQGPFWAAGVVADNGGDAGVAGQPQDGAGQPQDGDGEVSQGGHDPWGAGGADLGTGGLVALDGEKVMRAAPGQVAGVGALGVHRISRNYRPGDADAVQQR